MIYVITILWEQPLHI